MSSNAICTGDTGLIGTALCSAIDWKYLYRAHQDERFDLRNIEDTKDLFYSAKTHFYSSANDIVVYHLSAKVGGIGANINNLADFYRDNILMNTNVLEVARIARVKKLVSLASTCVYPDNAPYPLKESDLHSGEPHFSNYAYAFAKRMLDVQSRAYRDQYGCNFVVAIPTNVYGTCDNYDLQNGHAIPVLIHKIYRAKINNEKSVTCFGSGEELRDFIYVKDVASALITIMEKYDEKTPINIATGNEVSISSVVEMICFFIGYSGEVIWNGKLSGQFRKPVDTTKITKLGWKPKFTLNEGLERSCEWFMNNYPNVRGV